MFWIFKFGAFVFMGFRSRGLRPRAFGGLQLRWLPLGFRVYRIGTRVKRVGLGGSKCRVWSLLGCRT